MHKISGVDVIGGKDRYTQKDTYIDFALCATKKSGYREIAHVVHVSYCDL